ncbi:MAG: winged helix-turn-helix domain-containing protein [Candidatus Korarchaeum sp.]|nr:winged helix-turn-helix domain-containing protein [Candidatus Korarchaeum sp.]
MDWEVFTLEDERLKVLGQEISSDVGRRILALLKERPMSPNDLSKELEVPLTTIVFHVEKLRDAGLIKPLIRMAGRRGQKTLYTLSSSAFVILPISTNEDKERIFETLRTAMIIPRELLIKSAIVGLLIGVLVLFPWYFFAVSYYSEQRETGYVAMSENASFPNATIGPMLKGQRASNETQATGTSRYEEQSLLLVFLVLGVITSATSAAIGLLISKRSKRKVILPRKTPLG